MQISLGGAVARKGDGTLWCWGFNYDDELGDGTTSPPRLDAVEVSALGADVVDVSAGYEHTCARKGDGTLWCWGRNGFGQLGDGSIVDRPAPVQVAALGFDVVEVTAGGGHTCARSRDGARRRARLRAYA